MRKIYSFVRLSAVCLSLALTLPVWAQLPEENRVLDLGTHGFSEVVTIPQFDGEYFYVAPGEYYPKPQSASDVGDWAAYTRFHYTTREAIWSDYYGGHLSKIEVDNILCVNNGTDHIYLTQYEFDGGDVSKKINWDITITVAGGVVEVGSMVSDCEGYENPDPTVLKDTTIHYGDGYYDTELSTWVDYSIENYVGFRYVMSYYEYQDEWQTLWACINASEMNVVSSNPEVVAVEKAGYYDNFQLKGLKRGTATITVSVPAMDDPWNSEPRNMAKSVQYNVTVKGDEGPKIGFYQNSEPLTELFLEGSSALPAYTIYLSEDGYDWYSGDFTIKSSNEAVVTIDNPNSAEVLFTFHGYGTTTITATIPGNDYTEDATASFTLTYVDPNAVDLYFTDNEGNRITSFEVGTDEYANPVLPFEPRIVFEQKGEDLFSKPWLSLNIASEDLNIVDAGVYGDEHAIYMNCYAYGTTDIVATFNGDYGYSPATARLTVTYANTYRQPTVINIQGADLVNGEFNIMDTDSGSLGVKYYLPAVWLQEEGGAQNIIADQALTISSSDESVLAVRLSDYTDVDHFYRNIEFDQREYGSAVITVAFEGNETYAPAQASFVYNHSMNYSPMAECVVKDAEDNTLTDVVITEGDILELKNLVRADGESMSYNYIATASTTGKSCWRRNKVTGSMDFYPHAAGMDTMVYEYYRFSGFDIPYEEPHYWLYRETVKVPVTIMPYLAPVSHCVETTMNLDPEGNASLSFSSTVLDKYNSTEEQLEIKSVVSAANLQLALDSMATGKKEWNDLLPGATTFNLEAGKGKIEIKCQTMEGYELKVLVRDHGTVTITQPSMGIAEVNYDVDEVTAVLIYLYPSGGSSPAPQRRAPAAKLDGPNAIIKSIVVSPQDAIATGNAGKAQVDNQCTKHIENGLLIIEKNGVRYNVQGQRVE